jgi:hypothetical protein
MLLSSAVSLAQEEIRSTDSHEAEIEVSADTVLVLDDAEEPDPCVIKG